MTSRVDNVTFLFEEGDRTCEMCGKTTECRPYGPGGIDICWDCGQKDPVGTAQRMAARIFPDVIPPPPPAL